MRQGRIDLCRPNIAPESASRDGGENLRGANPLFPRTGPFPNENPAPARGLAAALGVVTPGVVTTGVERSGNLHPVHRRRTRLPGESRLAHAQSPDLEELHTAVVHTELERRMNDGTARVEGAAQRG